MRMFRTIIPMLLALALIGVSAGTIVAQQDTPTQFEDIVGLQKAYSRQFMVDDETRAGMTTPGATPVGWYALSVVIMEFDTEDHAAAGLDLLLNEITRPNLPGQDGEMEDVELDLDVEHVAMRDVIEASELSPATTTMLMAVAQDDRYVALVVALAFDEDPEPAVTSVLAGIVESDVSDDSEIFREEGISEGGLWAKFPSLEAVQAETPVLSEVLDETIYPVASRAISTPVRVQVTPATVGTPAG